MRDGTGWDDNVRAAGNAVSIRGMKMQPRGCRMDIVGHNCATDALHMTALY